MRCGCVSPAKASRIAIPSFMKDFMGGGPAPEKPGTRCRARLKATGEDVGTEWDAMSVLYHTRDPVRTETPFNHKRRRGIDVFS